MSDRKPRILFLCTGNACRSQMAEALLRHHWGREVDACSAGLTPKKEIHPLALRVLAERGIDTAGLRPKGVDEFLGKVPVTCAVVVCDRARQNCPHLYPFCLQTLHWPFDDPATFEGPEEEALARFRRVRDQIDERLRQWVREEGQALLHLKAMAR